MNEPSVSFCRAQGRQGDVTEWPGWQSTFFPATIDATQPKSFSTEFKGSKLWILLLFYEWLNLSIVYAIKNSLKAIHTHILQGTLWPDVNLVKWRIVVLWHFASKALLSILCILPLFLQYWLLCFHCVYMFQSLLCKFVLTTSSLGLFSILNIYTLARRLTCKNITQIMRPFLSTTIWCSILDT